MQSPSLLVAQGAAELASSADTLRRRKSRDSVEDRPHTAHPLQTTLTPAQGAVGSRCAPPLLPLDDLFIVVRELVHEGMSPLALAPPAGSARGISHSRCSR